LENDDIISGHLEYFAEIWEILWPFGKFFVNLVHFSGFWYHVPRKIWQPWVKYALAPILAKVRIFHAGSKTTMKNCPQLRGYLF
jgi:hypothetical protein